MQKHAIDDAMPHGEDVAPTQGLLQLRNEGLKTLEHIPIALAEGNTTFETLAPYFRPDPRNR